MKLPQLSIWCGVLLCSVLACQPKKIPEDARSTRVTIDRANSAFVRWTASGDVDSLATLFADSAWQFTIGAPPAIGKKAVRGYWATALTWGSWRFTRSADEVIVDDSVAIERGHYSLIFTAGRHAPAGITSSADHGHYLTYWRQGTDGVWRMTWTAPVSEVPAMVDLKL